MAGLPEGLVTNSETITGRIDSIDHVDVEDIITLWKVYSVNQALLADGAGRRLDNFFWRIWGSQDILNTITGSQIAVLFNAISEEGPLRTTPTQSPRTSRHIGSYSSTPPPSHSPSRAGSRLNSASNRGELSSVISETKGMDLGLQRPPAPERTAQAQASPYQGSSSDINRTAEASRYKIITEDAGDDSTPTATPPFSAQRFAPPTQLSFAVRAPDALSRPDALLGDSEGLQSESAEILSTVRSASSEDTVTENQRDSKKIGRKRTTFHVNTSANRRRPVAMRRKSSQSSSNAASGTTSPPLSVLGMSEAENAGPVDRSRASSSRSSDIRPASDSVTRPSPDSAIQDATRTSTEESSSTDRISSRNRPERSLVEPDFRSKFVAKTRSAQSSFISLPSLLRNPSATTAASASYQASGKMDIGRHLQPAGRGQARVKFSDDTAPPQITNPVESGSEPDGGAQALPRTRSQLTLLLEKDRRRGNGNGKGEKH